MDALKYDLKDTYIVRFNQKETEIAMTTNNLQVFYGNKQAFFDGNMQFPKNRITALIGASGSGKSTFLRSLNQHHVCTEGKRLERQGRTRPNR